MSVITLSPLKNMVNDEKKEMNASNPHIIKLHLLSPTYYENQPTDSKRSFKFTNDILQKNSKVMPSFKSPRNSSQGRISVVDINSLPEIQLPKKQVKVYLNSNSQTEINLKSKSKSKPVLKPAAPISKEKQRRLHMVLLNFREDLKSNSKAELPPELQTMMADPLIQKYIETEIINPQKKDLEKK